jgi:hypothetical protein
MPQSINGIGTQFYGHAEPLPQQLKRHFLSWLVDRDDQHESWIVTEWIIFLWVPLFPLRSLRVWPVDYEYSWWGNRSRTSYRVRNLPLYWPQVAWGYAITLGIFVVPWALEARNLRFMRDNGSLLLPLGIIGAIVIAGVVALLRHGERNAHGLTTTIAFNPFAWPSHRRLAALVALVLGTLIGGTVGFVVTARGTDFIQWIVDQPYQQWPVLGWGLLGAAVGVGAFLFGSLMSPQTQPSHRVLGTHPQSGRNVSMFAVGDQNIVTDGEVSVVAPAQTPPDDVTLGLASKLLQNRERSSKALRENEVDVRFVRRWGSAAAEIKVLFSQVYSLSELRYCRDQFVKGLKVKSADWNVAVRGLLQWAKDPNENMWYSVDLSLAAAALRAFPDISGRSRCIVWFDGNGAVSATLIKGEAGGLTVQLGTLPVRSA